MEKLRLLLSVIFVTGGMLFINHSVLAQHKNTPDIPQMEEDADLYFEDEEYKKSAEIYLKLDSLKPNNALYNYRIGICYFNSHQRAKALTFFQKCRQLNHHEKDVDFYLARTYHLNHEFDNAQKYYKVYKDVLKGDTADATLKRYKLKLTDLDRMVEMCDNGKKMVQDSVAIQIENMGPGINTIYPEYVPVVTADQTVLMFTSRRPGTTGGHVDIQDNHYYEDIYVSHKDSASKNWKEPENIGTKINTKFHDACIGLSPDGQKLFVYRSHKGKNSSGDIYESFLEGKNWTEPIKLTGLNTKYWESSATITSDGKTLYFTSDRPGGIGGIDIYVARLGDNGQWGDPINLGPTVNTPFDEDGPYIHIDNKTLFFSSRGHSTMGGYDIFTTVHDEKNNTWSKPANIGYPINTADDDIYFVWSADGTKGYFSSWREDTYGEKDLYVAHRPGGSANLIVLKGKVLNKETNTPIAATITITDIDIPKTIGIYNSNAISGNYAVILPHGKNYSISVEADGYVFFSDNYYIEPSSAFFSAEKNIYLEAVKVGSTIALKNVFFDFDKATIREESKTELNKVLEFLTIHSEIQVEISGHTDSLGLDEYNLKLSESRAKAVVDYLIEKGINKDRLLSKGYGESQPIASNATPEGRQMNRRTQFLIVGDSTTASEVVFENQPTFMVEYDPLRDKPTKPSKGKGKNKGVKEETGPKYKVGDKLKQKLHFSFKQSEFLTDFAKEMLDLVAKIMSENPSMIIRINSYSSNEGGAEMNRELSRKRAETVYNYLISKGVMKHRLETSFVSNQSTNKKGEMDMMNRRVDFEIIGF